MSKNTEIALRVATIVWAAITLIHFTIWALICIIGGGIDSPVVAVRRRAAGRRARPCSGYRASVTSSATCTRFSAPSLASSCVVWDFTVPTLMCSSLGDLGVGRAAPDRLGDVALARAQLLEQAARAFALGARLAVARDQPDQLAGDAG